jgi:glutamate--cysteine ligase
VFDVDKTAAMSQAEAEAHIHGICFKTGPPRLVGVELEWLVRDHGDPAAPVTRDRITAALASFRGAATDGDVFNGGAPRLASGARITIEPGGQLELSSAPAANLADLVETTAKDLTILRDAVASAGLTLAGYGLDPLRSPQRLLELPRYAAMERYFDRDGPWGRQMMCGTASVQVCLDAGDESPGPSGYRERWRLLHEIGPVLVAAFANSALRDGRPTGWRCARQQVWAHLDPGRTRPPVLNGDPRAAWAKYALNADVMCVPDPASADWSAPPGLRLRDWLSGQDGLRPPSQADLDYHLSTLFPPVRPHGYLELRVIDAQPGNGWVIPLAVVSALADDHEAVAAAIAAVAPVWEQGDAWLRAARHGPSDPVVGRASRAVFAAAAAALDRTAVPRAVRDAVGEFHDRYVLRDRCPADDQLEGKQ